MRQGTAGNQQHAPLMVGRQPLGCQNIIAGQDRHRLNPRQPKIKLPSRAALPRAIKGRPAPAQRAMVTPAATITESISRRKVFGGMHGILFTKMGCEAACAKTGPAGPVAPDQPASWLCLRATNCLAVSTATAASRQ